MNRSRSSKRIQFIMGLAAFLAMVCIAIHISILKFPPVSSILVFAVSSGLWVTLKMKWNLKKHSIVTFAPVHVRSLYTNVYRVNFKTARRS